MARGSAIGRVDRWVRGARRVESAAPRAIPCVTATNSTIPRRNRGRYSPSLPTIGLPGPRFPALGNFRLACLSSFIRSHIARPPFCADMVARQRCYRRTLAVTIQTETRPRNVTDGHAKQLEMASEGPAVFVDRRGSGGCLVWSGARSGSVAARCRSIIGCPGRRAGRAGHRGAGRNPRRADLAFWDRLGSAAQHRHGQGAGRRPARPCSSPRARMCTRVVTLRFVPGAPILVRRNFDPVRYSLNSARGRIGWKTTEQRRSPSSLQTFIAGNSALHRFPVPE